MSLAINTIIETVGKDRVIKPFKVGERYMSAEINELIINQLKDDLIHIQLLECSVNYLKQLKRKSVSII